MTNCFAEFLQTAGLYDSIQITQSNITELCELIGGKVKISEYCMDCNEKRVYTMEPILFILEDGEGKKELRSLSEHIENNQKVQQMGDMMPHFADDIKKTDWYWTNWQSEKATRIIIFPFVCSMDSSHHIDYVVQTHDYTMVKIGQYPSVADLSLSELGEFKKDIDKDSISELRRANGLFAHGIGVGSYVYLRRIFERILNMAKQQAEEDATIDLAVYDASRMQDKMKLLKDYLPQMINSSPVIYSIVSKGIHELSEDDCLKYFPILRDAIILILRQWALKRKEKESIKQLEASLSAIATEVK